MTELELFQSTIMHRPTGKFLFKAGYTSSLFNDLCRYLGVTTEQEIAEKFHLFCPASVQMTPPADRQNPDFTRYFKDMDIPENAFINGLGVLEIPGSMYHFTRYLSPLRNCENLDEITDFPFPNVDGFSEKGMAEMVQQAHNQGKVAVSWVGHMYEDSWQIRGYEQFLMDMLTTPEIPHYILDVLMNRNLKTATAAARAGVDYITTGDDVANQRSMMFSVDQWREFMKPRWAKVYEEARKIKPDLQIWYHSDGNIEQIIPDLIEIGVTILNPVQPECLDVARIKKEYGRDLVFDGVIGTQTTMPFGTPEDVRTAVKHAKTEYGYDGALILSPTHVLEPEVPVENVVAFFEECAE